MAALELFQSYSGQGLLLVAVHGLLTAGASLGAQAPGA